MGVIGIQTIRSTHSCVIKKRHPTQTSLVRKEEKQLADRLVMLVVCDISFYGLYMKFPTKRSGYMKLPCAYICWVCLGGDISCFITPLLVVE